jgi:16S rRNA processing protein RimM
VDESGVGREGGAVAAREQNEVDARGQALVELAAVVRAHGLAGELLLKRFNPDSDLLERHAELLLKTPAGEVRALRVRSARPHGEHLLLSLQGVDSREQAEALRGCQICIERAALPPLAEGEYYLIDLVGLGVWTREGQQLGSVEDVIEYPSANCLVVRCADGLREVPDLERYVLEVDVAGGRVVVDNIAEIEPLRPREPR